MQHGIRRASCRRYSGNRVLKRLAGKNVFGTDSFLQQIHDHLAAIECDLILLRVHGWDAVEAHGRQPDHLHYGRHRVRCVLSAACPGPWASHILQLVQFLVAYLAGSIRAHRLIDILNGHIFSTIVARRDSAAIQDHSRKVHSRQRHRGGRDRFVASDHAHHRIKKLPATNQFNGIGNHLAAYQRRPHALSAHGLAIRDSDGVELHGRATCRADSFLHFLRQPPQVKIARHGFDPGVGHADEGTSKVGIREANSFEHRARARPVAPLGDCSTAMLEIHGCKITTQV